MVILIVFIMKTLITDYFSYAHDDKYRKIGIIRRLFKLFDSERLSQ